MSAVEDAYGPEKTQPPSRPIFSFDENGNFKRQEKSRVEEGVYTIGMHSELVIYIEKVDGNALEAARVERYVIAYQSGDSITLQSGPSRRLVLRKR